MRNILEGMNILAKYLAADPETAKAHWNFAVEHDLIWCDGPMPDKLTPEDAARLTDLGFHFESDMGWSKSV